MAPDPSKAVSRITFLLVILAAMAVEIAAVDTRPIIESLALALGWCALATVAAFFVPLPSKPNQPPGRLVFLLLVGLTVVPFAGEPLRREWTGDGYPLELQMVFALRNVGLGLAVCSGWAICLRLAAVASLFLTLFAAAMTNHPAVMVLLGFYCLVGSVWLMLVNLNGFTHIAIAPQQVIAVEVKARREHFPRLALTFTVALALCVVGLMAFATNQTVRALGELLPTSGGTGDYDPFARGGINDGDDETKGNNAKSTGMTQTDSFLESPLPSLYDAVNEVYGPPFKTRGEIEQMIAIDAISKELDCRKRPPDNLRPNREFPTARVSPRKPNTPFSRSARAIFEVEGRTPLHVRVLAFDTFDGHAWHEAPMKKYRVPVEKEPTTNWMTIHGCSLSIFAEPETHKFKITDPQGSLIPTPPHLSRFRVGRVDQAVFFGWSHDSVLIFANRKTPSGIVVETECQTVDPRLLNDINFKYSASSERFDYHLLPTNLNPGIAALARACVEGVPSGWPQIAAVVKHLREDYTLDPAHTPPENCVDALAHFLLESRRGPDYQFASAAAVLLRSNGYRTRLVCGFYAHPDHYDPETRHTPVVKEDIHFWPEVMLPNGDWLVLEPTPGYEVAGPKLSLSERIKTAAVELGEWAWRNAALLLFLAVGSISIWIRRRALIDVFLVRFWCWFPGRTWREQVLRVVRLLERRGRWAGTPRTAGVTFASWLKVSLLEPALSKEDVEQLARMAEWATYAPDVTPPWPETEPLGVCRRVVDFWTVSRWRKFAFPKSADGV